MQSDSKHASASRDSHFTISCPQQVCAYFCILCSERTVEEFGPHNNRKNTTGPAGRASRRLLSHSRLTNDQMLMSEGTFQQNQLQVEVRNLLIVPGKYSLHSNTHGKHPECAILSIKHIWKSLLAA